MAQLNKSKNLEHVWALLMPSQKVLPGYLIVGEKFAYRIPAYSVSNLLLPWLGKKKYSNVLDRFFRRLTDGVCWTMDDTEAAYLAQLLMRPVDRQKFTGLQLRSPATLTNLCCLVLARQNRLPPGDWLRDCELAERYEIEVPFSKPKHVVCAKISSRGKTTLEDYLDGGGYARSQFRHSVVYYDAKLLSWQLRSVFSDMHWSWWSRFMWCESPFAAVRSEFERWSTKDDSLRWTYDKEVVKKAQCLFDFFLAIYAYDLKFFAVRGEQTKVKGFELSQFSVYDYRPKVLKSAWNPYYSDDDFEYKPEELSGAAFFYLKFVVYLANYLDPTVIRHLCDVTGYHVFQELKASAIAGTGLIIHFI